MRAARLDLSRSRRYNYSMDNEALRQLAFSHGFAAAYFTEPPRYRDEELIKNSRDGHIIWDASSLPFDVACILVRAYAPYGPAERIPSYYINSNRSYHEAVALAKELESMGVSCRRAELPVKSLLFDNDIAIPLKSSLAAIPPYGTRIAVQCMLLASSEEHRFAPEEYSIAVERLCDTCQRCRNACPAGAITENGYEVTRCMRYYMDGADYPDWVYKIQRTHIGCEVCQQVCPYNAALGFGEPSKEEREAYDLERLAAGDTKAARLLVGKNMTGNGKLQREAVNFINREKEK